MLNVSDLAGLWTRSLIAWPDGRRDTETKVSWLQGIATYADIRQLPALAGQFPHVRCLRDLTMEDCAKLATQQGFAGIFAAGAGSFEWLRSIDYQPSRAGGDVGQLYWQGDILVEEGVQGDYVEHWHRAPAATLLPCAALTLRGLEDGRWGSLLRVGEMFAYARDRQGRAVGENLAECIAGAADLKTVHALVDLEISFGQILADGWCITRSTLPFRERMMFHHGMSGTAGLHVGDLTPEGAARAQRWEIVASEGNVSACFVVDTNIR